MVEGPAFEPRPNTHPLARAGRDNAANSTRHGAGTPGGSIERARITAKCRRRLAFRGASLEQGRSDGNGKFGPALRRPPLSTWARGILIQQLRHGPERIGRLIIRAGECWAPSLTRILPPRLPGPHGCGCAARIAGEKNIRGDQNPGGPEENVFKHGNLLSRKTHSFQAMQSNIHASESPSLARPGPRRR